MGARARHISENGGLSLRLRTSFGLSTYTARRATSSRPCHSRRRLINTHVPDRDLSRFRPESIICPSTAPHRRARVWCARLLAASPSSSPPVSFFPVTIFRPACHSTTSQETILMTAQGMLLHYHNKIIECSALRRYKTSMNASLSVLKVRQHDLMRCNFLTI